MTNSIWLLAQNDNAGGIGAAIGGVVYLALVVLLIAGMWKAFDKAGKPGWASIIPIYNVIVMLEIAGKPLWWIILLLIPCVNLIVIILVYMSFAKSFGKSEIYGLGLAFLPFIFFPILGFGDSKYVGAAG
jgi:hypothetical protein